MLAFVEFPCLLTRFFFVEFFFLLLLLFLFKLQNFGEREVRGKRERERETMLEGQIKIRIINFFLLFSVLFCFAYFGSLV